MSYRERPILFSTPMVRAIRNGVKTQTRRIVKPKQLDWHRGCGEKDFASIGEFRNGLAYLRAFPGVSVGIAKCPYGNRGDRLWVRETHFIESDGKSVVYRANGEFLENWTKRGLRWKPSIFMPRWASRITLEVTGVRVERLQDITEADAKAEGLEAVSIADVPRNAAWSCRHDFANLWSKINGDNSWKSNPWVWVVEFVHANPSVESRS